ncbi:hypothetical protein AY599_07395 [Leptolyngbya valderiana BDU 20041]|uniref:chlorophyll a/b-binding protein n=1 Tax=Baaleninema simplex TaxID=2862350 RepID=UPI00034BEEB2|nr:hypothetical protein AY599_07395 [Leptolyngbya valderiana BDU 20041]PPT10598.1 hypothetical protein CKA32_005006 [Geitlerinema sp. FC II]
MAKPNAATDKGFGAKTDATKKSTTQTSSPSEGGTFGFTQKAEIWNGRLAMIGFLALVLIELVTNQGILEFFGLR